MTPPAADLPVHAAPRRYVPGPYKVANPTLAAALRLTDALLALAPARSGPLPADRPWRVLVSNTGHMGDLVTLIPLLAALRAAPQVARLDLVIGPTAKAVTDTFDLADRIHTFDHWRLSRAPGGAGAKLRRHLAARGPLARTLAAERYDVAIDTYSHVGNIAGLLWAARIPVRIGFTSGGGGPLYTHPLAWDHAHPRSMLSHTRDLLAPLTGAGLSLPTDIAPAAPGFVPDDALRAQLSALGPYLVFHLGRGDHVQAWRLEAWRAAADRAKADGYAIVFTGAAAERAYGEALRAEVGGLDLVGAADLRGFCTALQGAAGLLSIDTVAPHLAALFSTPTAVVSHHRPPPAWWRPAQAYATQVIHPVGCGPCLRTQGCTAMACVRDVAADTAYDALTGMIAQRAASPLANAAG